MQDIERAAVARAATPAPRVIPIASEGWVFILVPLAIALVLLWAGWWKTAALPLLLAAFMAFFFRDPERTPPAVANAVISPADGRVTEVRAALADPFVGPARQVTIFLSPLDVHVNRAAIGGRVLGVDYQPGGFRPAYRPEAETNERVTVALEGPTGRVVMRQVAGVLARRIVCRVRPGDELAPGQRFGMIKFGSRMDVIVPDRTEIRVRVGDRVSAGETVVGVIR